MRVVLLAGVASLWPAVGLAQTVATVAPPAAADRHEPLSSDIVVTAPFSRSRADILSGITVLGGPALQRELRATIGDTLSRQPGVSSTSFGPNASRPILRGFQGERVRVLTDGIGSFDVSNTSVDHAVVVNPQLAERIEVLRGPASLLYGSSAIGGVVNLIDQRIPRRVPNEVAHLDLLGQYGTAADERSFGGVLDVPVTSKVVVHADGSYLKSDDLGIGGFLLSRPARAAAIASGDLGATALANRRRVLPNSAGRTWQAAVGAALVDTGGDLGFSVSHYDSLYGVPARYDVTTGEGELVRLTVKQTRFDVRGGVNLATGFFDKLSVRFGAADYDHRELAQDGTVNTTFLNKSLEARLELSQRQRGGWRGATGVQLLVRDFDIIGAEAFVPRNSTEQAGVFTLQTVELGPLTLEGSGRYERTNLRTTLGQFRGEPNAYNRDFDAFSGSLGASYKLGSGVRVGVNLSRTERAPAAEEVLANGPHAGTQAFEIGDRRFGTERALGAEALVRASGAGYSLEASVFYNKFDGYIYEDQTGAIEDGLPVFQFRQGRARYYGAEAQATLEVARFGPAKLAIDGLADYVNATLLGGLGPVPRIPPLRALAGVTLGSDRLSARAEAEWADKQDRVARFEGGTDSYTLVNLSATWRPMLLAALNTSFVLSANNLLDVDARRHASFLKEFAPLPGRDIRVSARVVF